MRRRFNRGERHVIRERSGGTCALCGKPLGDIWHADHIQPYSKDGLTIVKNGQALCPECNQKKGNKVIQTWNRTLRRWQADALGTTLNRIAAETNACTVVAFPGAGKTTFALRIAHDWLMRGTKRFLIVVVPTRHLKRQFELAANDVGIDLTKMVDSKTGAFAAGAHGVVITYAQVNTARDTLFQLCSENKTLVIMDECHHVAGRNLRGESHSWGSAVEYAFSKAAFCLMMSGTLWRSDSHMIPFVEYGTREIQGKNETNISIPHYVYGYKEALIDTLDAKDVNQKVVRQLIFVTKSGETDFYHDMQEHHKNLDETLEKEFISPAHRTALDPFVGTWFENSFRDADQKLLEIRNDPNHPYPNAAGLVIASSEYHATEYAKRIKKITNEEPFIVHYKQDEPGRDIEEFRNGQQGNYGHLPRWIVSVNMISEGVDIPRLAVLFYATIVKERLYFHQAIGRVVRWDGRGPRHQIGYVFMPSLLPLTTFAEEIKNEIAHFIHNTYSEGGGDEIPQKLFVPLDNKDGIGPILTTIGDKRIAPDLVAYAAEVLNQNAELKIVGMTTEQVAMLLSKLDVAPVRKAELVAQALPSRLSIDDRIKPHSDIVVALINQARGTFFKADEDSENIFKALWSYFYTTKGHGQKSRWGEETYASVQAELEFWFKRGAIPFDLEDLYQHLKRTSHE